jgi:hypothetical protein
VSLDRAAGALPIGVPVAFNVFFSCLAVFFDNPAVLRRPAGSVLSLFQAGTAAIQAPVHQHQRTRSGQQAAHTDHQSRAIGFSACPRAAGPASPARYRCGLAPAGFNGRGTERRPTVPCDGAAGNTPRPKWGGD